MVLAFIESLRPRQWTKNVLVFSALLFVPGAFLTPDLLFRSVVAFVLFCLASGAGYIFNDIKDREYDRSHPKKRERPIASGKLPTGIALVGALVLMVLAIAGAFWLDLTPSELPSSATPLGGGPYATVATIGGYLILVLIYTFWFRSIPLLDVLWISIGFVLRAVAGAVALKVIISPWLLLCTGLLALYLALGKRRQEIIRLTANGEWKAERDCCEVRPALAGYSVPLLDQLLIIAASVNVMSYSLYTFQASSHHGSNWLMATIPFVVYGIFRYHSLIFTQDAGEAPDEVFLTDRPLAICVILWAIAVAVILLLSGGQSSPVV